MKGGYKLLGILWCSVIFFGGCQTSISKEAKNLKNKLPIVKYLALGDSYTIGESVKARERYPIQLEKRLETEGREVITTIIAQTGWRTDNLAKAIEQAQLKDTFDLVSVLIGVNDQFQGKTIQSYIKNFDSLLQMAIKLAGGKRSNVFVLSIPDYGYTPFGASNQALISEKIDNFNSINQSITNKYGIDRFDITPISRKGLEDKAFVASDGLHPSGKMYEAWVDLIEEAIELKMKK